MNPPCRFATSLWLLPLLGCALLACDQTVAEGLAETPSGDGPRVVWDLSAEPLPNIPLPNDIATWPDPTSPTGRRINVSLAATTQFESRLRRDFSKLDGWGTFIPMTVSFDGSVDTGELERRQGRGAEGRFDQHAVYLVDLESGLPVPLDVGTGAFPYGLESPDLYFPNDPQAGESNLLFESMEEDSNGNGRLDPGEDRDFDGVLDVPNTSDGTLGDDPLAPYDRILTHYERRTNTLILRPVLPLREQHEYAVVLTDRLRGANGAAVRSPFEHIHHLSQRQSLVGLPEIFAEHSHLYGAALAEEGFAHVAFAWTFTTQSVTADLRAVREGLYGRGPLAKLATEVPPRLMPVPIRGGSASVACDNPGQNIFIATPDQIEGVAGQIISVALGFDFADEQMEALIDSLDSVSHLALAFFESPYLLGDPDHERESDTFELDRVTGELRLRRDLVSMLIIVPKETETHQQPFPVTFYSHSYGSLNLEAVAFAGLVAQHGVATVAINAQGHGVTLDNRVFGILEGAFAIECLGPLGRALSLDRARDLNGDGTKDSAGLFFSAYVFHTRDTLRQTAIDYLQAVRVLRGLHGEPGVPADARWQASSLTPKIEGESLDFSGDVDGDGEADLQGDFDGDGVPDIGGWDGRYYQWGVSGGAIITGLMAGLEPSLRAAAMVSGGGGLFDIGSRVSLATVRQPIWLRMLGPLVVGEPGAGPSEESGCMPDERSLYFLVPDLAEARRIEFACVPNDALVEGDVVLVRNFINDEARCARVGADGRFRVGIPADVGDALQVELYREAVTGDLDFETCHFTGAAPEPLDAIDGFRVATGNPGPGTCTRCARFRQTIYELGQHLVAPAEGLGLRRQSSELRQLAAVAQMALDPGDPINYARNVLLEPTEVEDVETRPRSLLVINTAGDSVVPPSAGSAYARAAGLLPFLPNSAPDAYADYRAPAGFTARFGRSTPNDVLLDYHAIEGIARLDRHPVDGADAGFLFDVDNLFEGQQQFDASGTERLVEGIAASRLSTPLRFVRDSRAARSPGDLVFMPTTPDQGLSGLITPIISPLGQHVFDAIDPRKPLDETEYLVNLIGWFLASDGGELLYHTDPDNHLCLAESGCLHP